MVAAYGKSGRAGEAAVSACPTRAQLRSQARAEAASFEVKRSEGKAARRGAGHSTRRKPRTRGSLTAELRGARDGHRAARPHRTPEALERACGLPASAFASAAVRGSPGRGNGNRSRCMRGPIQRWHGWHVRPRAGAVVLGARESTARRSPAGAAVTAAAVARNFVNTDLRLVHVHRDFGHSVEFVRACVRAHVRVCSS